MTGSTRNSMAPLPPLQSLGKRKVRAAMTDIARGEGLTRDAFCERFKAHMLKLAGQHEFDDGGSIAEYADQAALAYWDDPYLRDDGPEECAAADVSYWGDE